MILDPWPCAGYTLSPASGVGRQLLVVNLRAVDIRIPIGESLIVLRNQSCGFIRFVSALYSRSFCISESVLHEFSHAWVNDSGSRLCPFLGTPHCPTWVSLSDWVLCSFQQKKFSKEEYPHLQNLCLAEPGWRDRKLINQHIGMSTTYGVRSLSKSLFSI